MGDNQNPVLARVQDGTVTHGERHETEGPDGRIVGLGWDGSAHLYVVYTIVGGGSGLEGRDGWLSAYAPGAISRGGPKVSALGRVSSADAVLGSATFVIAVKSDNKVNGHTPAGTVALTDAGDVVFFGSSAHKPIDADGRSPMDCTDYPFDTEYHFSPDLSELRCASSSNCIAQRPRAGE